MPFDGCGYCKQCLRLRTLKAIGRKPEHKIECAYKHILDSYKDCDNQQEDLFSSGKTEMSPSSMESCGSNCRWISMSGSGPFQSSSNGDSYVDYYFDPNIRLNRKRVKFTKKRAK